MATPINQVKRAVLIGVGKKTLKTEAKQLMVGDIPVPKTSAEVQSSITSPDDLTGDVAGLKIGDGNKKSCVVETEFEVDLDHQKTGPEIFRNTRLSLTASIVLGGVKEGSVKTTEQLEAHLKAIVDKNEMITVFLCGGPGASNPPDRNPEFNDTYLKNGGCIIFLDYRGTGKSILEIRDANQKLMEEWNNCYLPFLRPPYNVNDPDLEMNDEKAQKMAEFLKLFRHDDIVRDLEAIRLRLFGASKKWNIFGQSYGGWISLSYLSLFPEALESSRITAGLAPITSSPYQAYEQLFRVLKFRNDQYYDDYKLDVGKVKTIVKHLLSRSSPIILKNEGHGGQLTARRFLCLGRNLGARERWATMHELIKTMHKDITENKGLSDESIKMYIEEDSWKFDTRPVYAVLHEAMYCSDEASDWSARKVAKNLEILDSKQFEWAGAETESKSNAILADLCASDDNVRIHFSGEMVYPFMFEDYGYLQPLAGAAQELAKHKWNNPYDMAQLNRNQVPVYAISYGSDMHVNVREARKTTGLIKAGKTIKHLVLDFIPKPNSKDEEELKRTIRNGGKLDPLDLKFEENDGQFQHASVRSHAKTVLGCMEELAKRSEKRE